MERSRVILQIVPRPPGEREGVGDYALTLARCLREKNDYESVFISATPSAKDQTADGERIFSPLASVGATPCQEEKPTAIILHYVNYGYDERGLPFALLRQLKRLRRRTGARLLTIFHELYATGTWRRSAFWLQPLQKSIARRLALQSAACLVSSASLAEQLHRLCPAARVVVRPVPSNFGEPEIFHAQIVARSARSWAICGGTELIVRSLRSFMQRFSASAELVLIGGVDSPRIRELLAHAKNISAEYLPNVEVAAASAALSASAFGWLDYFAVPDVPTDAILKSTAFAAFCAHGVIPIFPQVTSPIALDGDAFPGPFSLENLPPESQRGEIGFGCYEWYQRHAASPRLAETIAANLVA